MMKKNTIIVTCSGRRSKQRRWRRLPFCNSCCTKQQVVLLALQLLLVSVQRIILITTTQVESSASVVVDSTTEGSTVVFPTTTAGQSGATEFATTSDDDGWNKAFQEIKQSTEACFGNVPLNNKEISTLKSDKNALDTFFDKILSNEAPYSIQRYMETQIGDTEMTTTKWNLSKDGKQHSRKITYIHPVSNPLAPPTAKAIRTQTLKRYGNIGMTLDTTTEVIGVPKTDCFVVEDRLLVEASSDKGKIKVTARFDLRFIKRTMFKSIITNQTTKEFNEWFQGFGTYLQQITKTGTIYDSDNDTASTVSMSSSSNDDEL